ncbi:MAG TPA: ABC transporter ATP-binding protein [Gemmatimonadaceae bacterium]|nr:ABC transporter ATP-binding protein [Gemmatimonadaceae bacterium]
MRSLWKLLPYYRPYRRHVWLGLLLVVLSSAIGSVPPWFLRSAVDGMRTNAPMSRILWLTAGIVGLAVVAGAMRFWMRELLNGLSRLIEFDLRNDLFERLTSLDATFYGKHRTGDLMARLTNDLSAVRQAAGPAPMYLANTVFGGVFALWFMLRIDARFTGLALLPMALLPVTAIVLGREIHRRFEAVQQYFGDMTTMAQENLSGVRVVRAYRQEGAEIGRFSAMGESYIAKNMHLMRLDATMHPAFMVLAGLGAVVVLGYGGTLVVRGVITVGDLVAFSLYLGMLTWPLIALGWVVNLFQRGGASMLRLLTILEARSEVREPAAPVTLPARSNGSGRSLEFRDVSFHYPASGDTPPRWVLRNVSFTVPAGATLGVVGATGSGKSALLDLVARIYDPQEGEILLDGVSTPELPLETLRGEIGYVPQESFLFSESIGRNLSYGAPDAASGRWGADVAQLATTIGEFPGGYDTLLGERGINLSGGQKQRAALARALARKPAVVLLDDALSAVDTHTEAEILHTLRTALAGRTAMISSHRVSAIRDATNIIVLDEGRVVEEGTHEPLFRRGGRYWSLLRRQQLEESLEDGDSRDDSTLAAQSGGDRLDA